MSDIGKRVKEVREARKLSMSQLASKAGIGAYQTIQDLESGKSRGTKHLVALARALSVSPNWLETGAGLKDDLDQSRKGIVRHPLGDANSGGSGGLSKNVTNDGPVEMLRVLGMAEGGPDGWNLFNGETVQYINRPANLVGVTGAYGVYVRGTSMIPRYEPGEIAHIHPAKPVQPGCYVLVQRRNPEDESRPLAVIKRLVRRTGSKVILAQLSPAKEIDVPAAEIVSIHRIVGSSEG